MRYIRTKNGIIFDMERIRASCNVTKRFIDFNSGGRYEIAKQADTIEELCDAYIITSKQGHVYDTFGDYGYGLKRVLPEAREESPYEDWDLYGCIIVDGIISQVAKMNDKGELELL